MTQKDEKGKEGAQEERVKRRIYKRKYISRRERTNNEKDIKVIELVKPKVTLVDMVFPPEVEIEIQDIVAYMKKKPMATPTVLLHGPPGTGKTLTASCIAGALKRPLAVAKVSGIIDSYLGVTEKLIERAFGEAMLEKAVLLLDEADTLLFSRGLAVRRWEISWTNILLKLLEEPQVPVILATNYLDKLDSALNRRILYLLSLPLPGPAERHTIWRLELQKAGIRKKMNLNELSQISLSGGLIRNAVWKAKNLKEIRGTKYKICIEELIRIAQQEMEKMPSQGSTKRRIGFGELFNPGKCSQ